MLGVNTDLSGAGGAGAAGGAAGGAAMGPIAGAAVLGGSQALAGIINNLYQQEIERKKREQEAMLAQQNQAGQYGQNQQAMLSQLLGTYKTALGV